jgi:hypothetical protein
VAQCDWHGLPAGTAELPSAFIRTTRASIMWRYVSRTSGDYLPRKYMTEPIFLGRTRAVPKAQIRQHHIALLANLANKPCTFAQLQQATGLADAALYFAGGITTDLRRAVVPRASAS